MKWSVDEPVLYKTHYSFSLCDRVLHDNVFILRYITKQSHPITRRVNAYKTHANRKRQQFDITKSLRYDKW